MGRYKDNKWVINRNKKGTEITCECPCGLIHDITFDSKKKFEGSGTNFSKMKWRKKIAKQFPKEVKIYTEMFKKSLPKKRGMK